MLLTRYNIRMTEINMHENNRLTVSFLDKSLILQSSVLFVLLDECWYCYSLKKLILALQTIILKHTLYHKAKGIWKFQKYSRKIWVWINIKFMCMYVHMHMLQCHYYCYGCKYKSNEQQNSQLGNDSVYVKTHPTCRVYNAAANICDWFAKRGLPHTSNLPTPTIHNLGCVKVINLKFAQPRAL